MWTAYTGVRIGEFSREIRTIGYLRLNFIDDYNNHMNGADIADQLWNQYRPNHWMRNRKWWWAFFIWGIGVAGVNAFKMYESMYKEEKKECANARRQSGSRGGMPRNWTHLEFMTKLVYDLIFPGNTVFHLSTIGELDDQSIDSTRSFSSFASVDEKQLGVLNLWLTSKSMNRLITNYEAVYSSNG